MHAGRRHKEEPLTQKLDPQRARELLSGLPEWKFDAERGAISHRFKFGDFAQAFSFMTRIALHAEKHDITRSGAMSTTASTSR